MAYYTQKHKIGWGLNEKPCDNQKIKNKRSKKKDERKEEKMRKNVWKRFLAAALSAVIVFTSVDASGLVVKAKEGTTTTKTLGEIVSEFYKKNSSIKASEVTVLTDTDLVANSDSYEFVVPKAEDLSPLVKFQPTKNQFTVDSYSDDNGIRWSAIIATVNDEKVEAELNDRDNNVATFSYDPEKLDTGALEYVDVVYQANVDIDANAQLDLVNTTYYVYRGKNATDSLMSDTELEAFVETIAKSKKEISDIIVALSNDDVKAALEAKEITVEISSELKDAVNGLATDGLLVCFGEYEESIEFWRKNAEALSEATEKLEESVNNVLNHKEELYTLGTNLEKASNELGSLDTFGIGETGIAIKNEYIPAYEKVKEYGLSDYKFYDGKTGLVKEGAKLEFPKNVDHIREYGSEFVTTTTFWVDVTATTQADAGMRGVTLNVEVALANGAEPLTGSTMYVVDSELNADAVKNLEDTTNKLNQVIVAFNNDGLSGNGYVRDNYNLVEGYPVVDLEKNTIDVKYQPKEYKVTFVEDIDGVETEIADLTGNYQYGHVITFQDADNEDESYVYSVDGETLEAGDTYTVLKENIKIKRILKAAKVENRVNTLAQLDYADELDEDSEFILTNGAVDSKTVNVREPEANLVYVENGVLFVPEQKDGDYTWVVEKIAVDGVDISDKLEDNKITLKTTEYDFTEYDLIEVEYVLDVAAATGVDAAKIVNLPVVLVNQSKEQLADMDYLMSKRSNFSSLNSMTLNLLEDYLTPGNASVGALKTLREECFIEVSDGQGGTTKKLALTHYTDPYYNAGTDKEAKLKAYYQYDGEIKTQVQTLVKSLTTILADETAMNALRDEPNPMKPEETLGSVVDELNDKLETIKDLADESRFDPMNKNIIDTHGSYDALITNIISGKVNEVTNVDGIKWTVPVKVLGEKTKTFTVKVVVNDGNAAVSGVNYLEETITFRDGELAPEAIAELTSKVAGFEENINPLYYACIDEELGEILATGQNPSVSEHIRTWNPVEYKVVFVDNSEDAMLEKTEYVVSYGKESITLPMATKPDWKYTFNINGEFVEQGKSYKFEIDKFFTQDKKSVTISATKENVVLKKEENFFKGLQESVSEQGMAVIPFSEDGKAISAAVLRITDAGNNGAIMDGMMALMTALVNPLNENGYEYIGIGGYDVKTSEDVFLQGLVNAILSSGASTETLAAMFTDEGKLADNTSVAGNPIYVEAIQAVDELGAFVLKTKLKYDSKEIDLYITLNDFDETSEELADRAKLRKALVKMNRVMTVECGEEIKARTSSTGKNPVLVVTVNEPYSRNAYEAYLVAMILEGRTTFDEIGSGKVTLEDIVDYEYDRVVSDLKEDDEDNEITVLTVANTFAKFDKNIDLSEYEDTFNMVKDFIFNGGKDAQTGLVTFGKTLTETVKFKEANDGSQAADTYYLLGTAAKDTVFEKLNVGNLANYISDEEYKVPVKVVVKGVGKDYAAAVINDPRELKNITGANVESAKLAANTINLLTAGDLAEAKIAKNAMVIMLAGDATVTLSGNAIVDLNGKNNIKLAETADFDGTIVLVDSTYGNDAKNVVKSAHVKDGRLGAEDRCYTVKVTTDDATNKETLRVALDAGFLKDASTIEMPELKVLACELAFDLVMNNITSCDMLVTGTNGTYNLYDVDAVDDIFEFIGSGKESIVNKMIDIVNLGVIEESTNDEDKVPGLVEFINEVIATLSLETVDEDGNETYSAFAKLAAAAESGNAFASYEVVTHALNVNFAVAGEGDDNYLTAGIETTDNKKEFTVEFVIGGTDADKTDAKNLFNELSKVVEVSKFSVDLDDINYTSGNLAAAGAKANGELVVNLIRDDNAYAVAFAAIVAHGMEEGNSEKAALVKAINEWLTTPSKATYTALELAVEGITTAQIIDGVVAAYNKPFDTLATSIGVTADTQKAEDVESIYHDALNVLYRLAGIVVNRFGIEGNDTYTLGLVDSYFDNADDGIYTVEHAGTHKGVYTDAKVVIKLFGEFKDNSGSGDPDGPTQPEKPSKPSDNPDNEGGNQGGGSGSKPSKPSKPSDNPDYVGTYYPTQPGTQGVQTGDASNAALWITLMGIAIVAVIGVYTIKKRNSK